jgi:hypothetical protein
MNDAAQLLNLLVAICGDQVRDYRPQLEAMARKLANTGRQAGTGAAPRCLSSTRRLDRW